MNSLNIPNKGFGIELQFNSIEFQFQFNSNSVYQTEPDFAFD